ncbi:MAG: FtsX-like permease family protein, partial [Bacteroidales bacterium]|nr:FtsX-like permease family protein [Bacteroidales bacterium]
VEKKMNQVLQKHITPQLHSILGVSPEEWADGGNRYEVYLQPLTDIHLNPDIELGVEICFRPVHDRNYIYIFAVIAFFILIIAGINFTNLSTARSVLRSREIGLRKAVGSQRTQIIWQFLAESVLLSLISLMVALFIVEISLPWFNRTMDLNLSFDTVGKWFMIMAVILLSIFIGLLSGIYPALFVARYRPIEGIKGLIIGGKGSGVFRRVMVIIQFSISVMIIIGTFIVFTQLNLLLNKDMGFDKDNLVVVSRVYPLGNKIETFCREVEKYPEVKSASNSSAFLGFTNTTESFRIKGRDISKNYLFATNYVDPSFLQTYNLKLVNRDSRFFNPDVSSDSSAILVNRAAVREYGMTDPLKTTILEQTIEGDTNELHIIGVLEDFHHNSLKDKIMPYMLRYKGENTEIAGYITIRMSDDRRATGRALKKIEDLWLSMTNDEPFQFFFLDEEIDNYYKEERRTGRLSLMFAILATLIACLGLFGLTLYNTQRRVREIGIRKAMGASIGNIIYLVSKEVMVMMFFSVIFAWLAAYLLMQELWLQDFPYNIGFRPWIYLISAVTALIIALITVAGMAYSSAVTNPSEALHYE